ncbi:MAG TPA: hypothetical protein P5307_28525, partial [Pirellulaceae bacterium]|nr:hypothetical protein [Pirellulaceae bacterium]
MRLSNEPNLKKQSNYLLYHSVIRRASWAVILASLSTLSACSPSTPTSIDQFFGETYKIERIGDELVVTLIKEDIWNEEAELNDVSLQLDRLGKWLQADEGMNFDKKVIKLTREAQTKDAYGTRAGHAKLFTLSAKVADLRRIDYEQVARFTIDFTKVEYVDPVVRRAGVE